MNDLSTLLLVHGAWMGPWQWDFLVPELDRRGIPYAGVALPSCGTDSGTLGSLQDDVAAIEAAAREAGDRVVVVAHSYAGIPATQANYGSNLREIVYLGAFMPDEGRSLVSYLPPGAFPPFVHLRADGKTNLVQEQIPVHLCNECGEEQIEWLAERVVLQAAGVVMAPVDEVAWRTHPSFYIVLENDRVIPADLQRVFAAQASDSVELASDHFPMLSHPGALAETLEAIVSRAPANAGVAT